MFTLLCKELIQAFDKDAAARKKPRLGLSAAVSASHLGIDAGYEAKELGNYLDILNLMAYDLHGIWDKVTGHHAAMAGDGVNQPNRKEFTIPYAVDHWIKRGFPAKKIALGLGTYGRAFFLKDAKVHGLGAPIEDRDWNKAPKGEFTREEGFLAYYEICKMGLTVVQNSVVDAPYGYKDKTWVGYDDQASLKKKVESQIIKKGLAGAMFWCLDLDDFNGQHCGQGRYPLMSSVAKLLGGYTPPVVPTFGPTTKGPSTPSKATDRPATNPPSGACKAIDPRQLDRVLFLKTIHNCCRAVATETLVEDMFGDVAILNVYNYVLPEEDPQNIFPRGTFLALCQPYFRFPLNDCKNPPVLRTDNPETIILFDTEKEWQLAYRNCSDNTNTKIKIFENAIFPTVVLNETVSEEMCNEGNKYFKTNHLMLALKWYNKGLLNFPTNIRILSNRAAVNIVLEKWSDVIADTNIVLNLSPNHLKARYRKAYAMLCLNKPRDTLDILEPLSSKLIQIDSVNLLIKNAEQALKEIEGIYNIKAMVNDAENFIKKVKGNSSLNNHFPSTIHMNFECSDLEIKLTHDKGRGVFATKRLSQNQLVSVEKAGVHYIYDDSLQHHTTFNSDNSNRVSHSIMLPLLVQKIIRNSQSCNEIYQLADGFTKLHLQESSINTDTMDKGRVDIVRLRGIIESNAFSSILFGKVYDFSNKSRIRPISGGLFYRSSYYNHSCIANCDWFPIGKYLFIITNRCIEAGSELTIQYTSSDAGYEHVQKSFVNWNNYGGFICYCEKCHYLRDNPAVLNASVLIDKAYSEACYLCFRN